MLQGILLALLFFAVLVGPYVVTRERRRRKIQGMSPPADLDEPMTERRSVWWPSSRWGTALLVLFLAFTWVAGFYTAGGSGIGGLATAGIWYLIIVGVRAVLPGPK